MTKIRVSVVLLLVWLLFFYVVDLWSPDVKFAPAVDVLLPAAAGALLLFPQLQHIKLSLLLPALIGILLGVKWATGAAMVGAALPTTITEACALTVTALLARYVSNGITSFEDALVHMSVGQLGERRARIGEVYREVRRARAHRRPLSILAVRYESGSVNVALDRIVREAQAALVRHYLLASIAKTLNEALEDFNIVARRGDHFLIVLPETPPEGVPEMVKRLRRASLEQVGVNLQIGAASLPDDAATLEGLMEKAAEDMQSDEVVATAQPAGNFVLGSVPVPEVNHGNADRQ